MKLFRSGLLSCLALSVIVWSSGTNATLITVDPDYFSDGAIMSAAIPGVNITAIGPSTSSGDVFSIGSALSSTGSRVFGWPSVYWSPLSAMLKIDFVELTDYVHIDVIRDGMFFENNVATIFNSSGIPISTSGTGPSGSGVFTVAFDSGGQPFSTADIDYMIVYGSSKGGILIDNLI